MSRRLETALDESLARLKNGESVESCLERHPEVRDQLEPLLRVAGSLNLMAAATTSADEALARGRQRFMAQVYERRALQVAPKCRPFWMPVLQRGFAMAAIAVMLIMFLLGGTGIVSANSLPGDPLYGVKLASENVRIWLTPDFESRLVLEDYYESLRVAEVKEVLERGRETQVSFSGVVERIEGNTVIVQGIPVQLADVLGSQQPVPGTKVQVVAQTKSDGTVSADLVDIKSTNEQQSAPTTTAVVVEAATDTATATSIPPAATPPEKQMPSRKATATAVETATALPPTTEPPTALPPAQPTATVVVVVPPSPTALPTMIPSPTASAVPTATPVPQQRDIPVRIEGRIDVIASDHWRVDGKYVQVGASTKIDESAAPAEVGGWVMIKGLRRPDHSLVAQQITVVRGPERTPVIQEFSGIIEKIAADHWIISGRRVEIVADSTVEGNPRLGNQAHVRAELKADGVLVARSIRVDPESLERVQIEGIIEKIKKEYWVVAGQEIWLDPAVEIEGEPAVGALAEVEAVRRADGRHWGLHIEIQTAEPPTETPTATVSPTKVMEMTPVPEETAAEPTLTATIEPATATPTETVASTIAIELTASATTEAPTATITQTQTLEATATLILTRN